MTDEGRRVEELSSLLYGIDFVCRSSVNPAEAVWLVQELCSAAEVEVVRQGRTVNGWKSLADTYCLQGVA
mgnify:CR=1 FL=1